MRIAGEHAIDLLRLSGAQLLVRIEAPASGEQPLAPQDFVNAGDAPGELVRRIEQRGVGVGQLGAERQQARRILADAVWQRCSSSTALLVQTAH